MMIDYVIWRKRQNMIKINIYDYIFYKFYRLALYVNNKGNLNRSSDSMIFSAIASNFTITGIPLVVPVTYFCKRFFVNENFKFVVLVFGVIWLTINCFYFYRKKRYEEIIKLLDKQQNEKHSKIKHLLFVVILILYLVISYSLIFWARGNYTKW